MNLKKILSFSLGPIGVAVLGMATLPLLTWIFPQEEIGRISLLHVVVSFTILFCSLGLDQSYVREYHQNNNKPGLLLTIVLPSLVLLIMLITSVIFGVSSPSETIFEIKDTRLDLMLYICLSASFFIRYLSLVLRMEDRGLAFSMSQLLPKLVFLIIIVVYVAFPLKLDFFYLMLAQTVSLTFVFLLLVFLTRKELLLTLKQSYNCSELKPLLAFGFPLAFSGLAFWGITALDRFFLQHYSSYTELGLYSVAISFAGAAMLLKTIFSILWAPTVYKWVADDEDMSKVDDMTELLLFIVAIAFCVFGLFSWLVTYILPVEYNSVQYLMVACIGFPLFYTLAETSGIGINVMKKSLYNLYTSLIALVANIVLNFLLIPSYGAIGAAAATIISFWLFLFFRTFFSRMVWRVFPVKKLYIVTFCCMALSIMHLFLTYDLKIYVYVAWLVFSLVILFSFKSSIIEIKEKIKSIR